VARRGVTRWEPAWVCGRCGAETFVRHAPAKANGAAHRARRSAGAAERGDSDELRRVVADIRARAMGERGESGAARRRTDAFFGELTSSHLVSVLVADHDARLVEANTAACALIGLRRDHLLKLSVRDVFTEHPRFDRAWQRFLDDGEFSGACRLRQHSGRLVTVECVASTNVVPGIHVGALASRRLLQSLGSA